jgi:hypothetical protein
VSDTYLSCFEFSKQTSFSSKEKGSVCRVVTDSQETGTELKEKSCLTHGNNSLNKKTRKRWHGVERFEKPSEETNFSTAPFELEHDWPNLYQQGNQASGHTTQLASINQIMETDQTISNQEVVAGESARMLSS